MRLGLLLGLVAGGVLAYLIKETSADDPGPLGVIKRQLMEASEAAKEEAAEKEAEMLADYESAKHGNKPKTP
jgi:hypothetical protein